MMARCLPGILPPLHIDEALEITRILGLVGAVPPLGLVRDRPFRAPHHTTSYCGLVGGGSVGARPGEVSLAHKGVLFLDELPEFPRKALEALREPLEARRIAIARAWGSVELPADFQLVAAMNPCPCGYRNDPRRACRCGERELVRYAGRISGPLMDRIDLQVAVRPVEPEHLIADHGSGSPRASSPDESALDRTSAAALVLDARARQRERARALGDCSSGLNARLTPRELEKACVLDREARAVLREAVANLTLTARGIVKVKRIARTLADLAHRDSVTSEDLSEALLLRRLDEPLFAATAGPCSPPRRSRPHVAPAPT
jgi:magnesium chelatase family protein